ncbi:MAG: cupin protein [Firmicutes bacterium]|nr:cupin protein [Bacillota bacterium]
MGQTGINLAPGARLRVTGVGVNIMSVTLDLDAGAAAPLHQHPHEQVSCVTKGRVRFMLEGRSVDLAAGDTIYVPGGAEHGVVAVEPATLIDVFTPLRLDLLERA